MGRYAMTGMGDVWRVLGINVTRHREKGAITIDQNDCTEDIVERFGMNRWNLAFTPGAGPEHSLNQPEKNLLDKEGKGRYQSLLGAAMYLAQVSRYDILYAVNQLVHAQAFQGSHGGCQASASLLGRVHRLLHHLQAGSV